MGRRNQLWMACGAVALAWRALAAWGVSAEPQNDFRFALLGDRTGDADPQIYERVWRDLDSLHPDFVVNVGDTIQGGNDATAESEWRALQPLWNRYKYQQFFTPGNHDIWSPLSRRIYEKETGHPAFYSFNFQNAHFTVLDNSETESLGDEQMQFLDRDLARNRNRDPKFVLFHKPFWLLPVMFRSSQFPFHQLVKKYNVEYVISGHTHEFLRVVDDGVVYMEAGSSGAKLKGADPARGWFFGQILARVKGSTVEMTVHQIPGPTGPSRSFPAEQLGR